MTNAGICHMGIGQAAGESRAATAIRQAINSPLLDTTIDGARGVLINFTGGHDMKMREVDEAASVVRDAVSPEADIIVGAVIDENMQDEIMITVIASGFDGEGRPRPKTNQTGFAPGFASKTQSSQRPMDNDIPSFLRNTPTSSRQTQREDGGFGLGAARPRDDHRRNWSSSTNQDNAEMADLIQKVASPPGRVRTSRPWIPSRSVGQRPRPAKEQPGASPAAGFCRGSCRTTTTISKSNFQSHSRAGHSSGSFNSNGAHYALPILFRTRRSGHRSRPTDDHTTIRRRRECLSCGQRFDVRKGGKLGLFVVKKDGSRQAFDREKLIRGILKSCEKRPVTRQDIEDLVDGIEQSAMNQMKREITSQRSATRVEAPARARPGRLHPLCLRLPRIRTCRLSSTNWRKSNTTPRRNKRRFDHISRPAENGGLFTL